MGIKNLNALINIFAPNSITKKKFEDFKGKKIAIDASLLIYQYVIAIRNTAGDLTNTEGDMTSHIHAVVSKSLLYLDNEIIPIFVFDGKPSNLKNDTLDKRREDREINKKLMNDNMDDEDKKIKYFKRSTHISFKQMDQCKEVLKAMGIPVIESLEESDSQCALLTKSDIAYGVGTEDMDILTFGSKKLLRNISSSKKNEIVEYDLQKVLDELNYTHDEFIDLCILLGCDYVDHLEGIGIRKAKEIIDEHRSINNYLNSPQYDPYIVPNGYAEKCNSAKEYFKNPVGTQYTNTQLKLTTPDQKKLRDLLINKYSYSKTKTEKIIAKIVGI